MAVGPLMPFVRAQWLSSTGVPLAGYTLFTYLSGTDTPTDTFTTSAISTPNAWPVVLDSAGRATVYLDPALTFKFVMADPTSTAITGPLGIVWTNDGVPGLVDPFSPPVTFEIDAIGSTPTDAAIFLNATSAANNAQQWSPRIRFTGAGWNATAAASRVVDATEEAVPIQQASGDPVVALTFSTQVNGGGYSPRMSVQSDGAAVLGSSGKLAWSSSGLTAIDTAITRLATKVLALDDGLGSNGVTLNFATNDTLTVKNRANNANGAIIGLTLATTGTGTALAIAASSAGATLGASIRNTGGTSASTVSALAIGQVISGGVAAQLSFRHQFDDFIIANQKASGGGITLSCSNGDLAMADTGSLTFSNTAATLSWSAQSKITNTANGSLKLTNSAVTAGVILKFSADGTLQVLDRSAADNALITALNITATGSLSAASYVVAGNNGADFSGVVTSITVVKGIVTAAS